MNEPRAVSMRTLFLALLLTALATAGSGCFAAFKLDDVVPSSYTPSRSGESEVTVDEANKELAGLKFYAARLAVPWNFNPPDAGNARLTLEDGELVVTWDFPGLPGLVTPCVYVYRAPVRVKRWKLYTNEEQTSFTVFISGQDSRVVHRCDLDGEKDPMLLSHPTTSINIAFSSVAEGQKFVDLMVALEAGGIAPAREAEPAAAEVDEPPPLSPRPVAAGEKKRMVAKEKRSGGCTSDAHCKGGRVCVDGACTSPDDVQEPPPIPEPAPGPAEETKQAARPAPFEVVTDPPGADVAIDTRSAGRTPLKKMLKPGRYLVNVAYPGRVPVQRTVTVSRDGVSLKLRLRPSRGKPVRLLVETQPAGARIVVNDEDHGTTPANLKIAPGRYQVSLTLEGYEEDKRSIDLDTAASEKLAVKLKRQHGMLRIDSTPAGAKIMVNGDDKGTTPLMPISLPTGTHQIMVQIPDREPYEQAVEIQVGKTASIDIELQLTEETKERRKEQIENFERAMEGHEKEAAPLRKRRKLNTIIGATSLGVGVASLAAAGVLYGIGASQGSTAHDAYSQTSSQSVMDENREIIESSRTKLIVGHVLAGVGVAAVVVGIWQLVVRPEIPEQPVSPSFSSLGLAPAPGGLVLSIGGAL